jgi:Protein of unknown function (DUF3618)
MVSQIEQFEREAEETRSQLAGTLDELRERVTPGRVVDQLLDYARSGAAGEFLRNLGREARENPMPIVLIGIGIAWLIVASSRTSREAIGSAADSVANAADSVAKKAADIGGATSAAVSRTSEWGRQRAAQISERTSNAARAVSDTTTEVAGRAREIADGAAESARAASAMAGAAFEKVKRPFTGTAERDGRAIEGALESIHREREHAFAVEAAALEHR